MSHNKPLKKYQVTLYLTNIKPGQGETKVIEQQARSRDEAATEACIAQAGVTPKVEWFKFTVSEIK